jgi:hypothetical protein
MRSAFHALSRMVADWDDDWRVMLYLNVLAHRVAEGEGFDPSDLSASGFQAQGVPPISVRHCTPGRKKWAIGAFVSLSRSNYSHVGWRGGWRSNFEGDL